MSMKALFVKFKVSLFAENHLQIDPIQIRIDTIASLYWLANVMLVSSAYNILGCEKGRQLGGS